MTQNLDQSREEKLQSLLRRRAPNSIIDIGIRYALEGQVLECSKTGHKVQGIVRDNEDNEQSLNINVLSASSVSAQCTCSSDQEMNEQWCPHAIALIQRAFELDFFDPNSGFVSDDAGFRINTSSPREIAEVVR